MRCQAWHSDSSIQNHKVFKAIHPKYYKHLRKVFIKAILANGKKELVSGSLACKPSKTWNLKQNSELDCNPEFSSQSIMYFHSKNVKSERKKPWFEPKIQQTAVFLVWAMIWYQSILDTRVDSHCLEYLGCINFESVLNFPTFSMSKKIAWVWCNLVHIPWHNIVWSCCDILEGFLLRCFDRNCAPPL